MYDKFMTVNPCALKEDLNQQDTGNFGGDDNEINKPLLPKKLSFNSWISSDTPEKLLEVLKGQLEQRNKNKIINENNWITIQKDDKIGNSEFKTKPLESSLKLNKQFKILDNREGDPHPRTIQHNNKNPSHSRDLILKRISYLKQKKLKQKQSN